MIQRIQWWKSLDISKLYEVVFAVTVGFPSLDWTIGFGVILNHWAMIKLLKIFQTTYCKFCDMVCFICWWLLYKIALSLALFTSCLYKILKLMTFVWGKFCACIGNELHFIFTWGWGRALYFTVCILYHDFSWIYTLIYSSYFASSSIFTWVKWLLHPCALLN